jgi:hypothetical protein
MNSNAMFLIDLRVVPNAAHGEIGFCASRRRKVYAASSILNGQPREIDANENKSPDRSGAIDA